MALNFQRRLQQTCLTRAAAAGWRCTATLAGPVPLDRCGDYFDEDGRLPVPQPLPVFTADTPSGCAVFADKLGLMTFKLTDE